MALVVLGAAACSNELKITEAEPGHGIFTGNEEIVIKGNGFQPGRGGVTVKFGKRDAQSIVVESPTKIKVQSPAGDKNTTVDISVVFDDGRGFVLKNGFRYLENQQAATMDKAFNAFGDKDKKPAPAANAPAPAPAPAANAPAPAPAANAPAPAPAANAPAPK
jgi:hypothetical protein